MWVLSHRRWLAAGEHALLHQHTGFASLHHPSPCLHTLCSHKPTPQPPAPRGPDVRSGVQRLVEEAQRLPKMPPYVSYDALLADLQQWIEALEGCTADVAAAQQVGGRQGCRIRRGGPLFQASKLLGPRSATTAGAS